MTPQQRQKKFDKQYAELERGKPRPPAGRVGFDPRTFNDYCREMDEWTASYNRLLARDGEDACK